MTKAALGSKCICVYCTTKFYDLNKRPVTCPKCHKSFDPDTLKNSSDKQSTDKTDTAPEDTKKEEVSKADIEDNHEDLDPNMESLEDAEDDSMDAFLEEDDEDLSQEEFSKIAKKPENDD